MPDEFINRYQSCIARSQPFAVVTIVRTEKPSSAKPGDKAIITSDGKILGWIGGGCTRSIVIHEAKNAIHKNKTAFVRIAPGAEYGEFAGIKTYNMTCHSGGTVDVFIEPVLPKPQIVIFGKSAVAKALCKLSAAMDYRVHVLADKDDIPLFPEATTIYNSEEELSWSGTGGEFVIVCTQGEGDENHLRLALESRARYISFVSSRRKANAIFRGLRSMGCDFDALKRIKTPAGLDLGAKLPEEIAVSIIAEIISTLRSPEFTIAEKVPEEVGQDGDHDPQVIVNPVCNLPIQRSDAKYIEEKDGLLMYFCCEGCKKTYDGDPEKYWQILSAQENAS